MTILTKNERKINTYSKFNFEGGNLSSDSGLLLFKKFLDEIEFDQMAKTILNLENENQFIKFKQRMYTTIAGYPSDTVLSELKNDPMLIELLKVKSLASQPTMSRHDNSYDESNLKNFETLNLEILKKTYEIKEPKVVILDIDSTGIRTYGKQEGQAFNGHYREVGFHPLVLFDGITGDLLKVELRPGNLYTSNGVEDFMQPVIDWYQANFPKIKLIFRGDSGFAVPDLYKLLERNNIEYVIRLKYNKTLGKLSSSTTELFGKNASLININESNIAYDSFKYQAGTWDKERTVAVKVERKRDRMDFQYTYIVTSMTATTKRIVEFYANRGKMENYIKEAKNGFDMLHMSHSQFIINQNKLAIKAICYNLNNLMRRLVFPKSSKKYRIESIRTKFFKIASEQISSGGYKKFKLASSYPHKKHFFEIIKNISKLNAA